MYFRGDECKMKLDQMWKQISKHWLFSSAITIFLGLLLLLMPGFITKAAGYVLGIGAVVFGGSQVIRYFQEERIYPEFFRKDLMVGLLAATLGILILIRVEGVISLAPAVLGAVLFSNGVVGLQRAINARKAAYPQWWMLLIFALLTLALGLVLIINPFGSVKAAVMVVGGGLIYEGISDILTMLFAGKKIDGWKRPVKQGESADSQA